MSINTSSSKILPAKSKGINITLWVLQSLLAAFFLFTGRLKLVNPGMVKGLPLALIYFIAIVEVLGALGIMLPSMLRIKPILTPLAALGFAIILVLAAIYHFSRGEGAHTPIIFVFLAMTIFVAWGRFKKEPIQAR